MCCFFQEKKCDARTLSFNKKNEVLTHFYDDAKTLYELFLKAKSLSNDGNYLGWKPKPNEPYKYIKYSEVYDLSRALGSGFVKFDIKPATEAYIGIYARNRPEVSLFIYIKPVN